MEREATEKFQAARYKYEVELQESLKRRKELPAHMQKKWIGRRTKLSNVKIYEDVNDLFEAV